MTFTTSKLFSHVLSCLAMVIGRSLQEVLSKVFFSPFVGLSS